MFFISFFYYKQGFIYTNFVNVVLGGIDELKKETSPYP